MEKKIITLTEGELKTQITVLEEKSKEEFCLKCKKVTSEDEDVMKRYWNINREGNYAPILLEKDTIDRLMRKHGDKGFIIISANRSDESGEYNVQKTQELIADLKLSKYSYLPVYGGYKGTDGVTDKSISNWENGRNMPDLSLFKPLCELLDITINDLISGEKDGVFTLFGFVKRNH